MLTLSERVALRSKIRAVEEAIEDLRAYTDFRNNITLAEAKTRGVNARTAVEELKRYMEEDLS